MKLKEFIEIARISYNQIRLNIYDKEERDFLPQQEKYTFKEINKYENWEIAFLNLAVNSENNIILGEVVIQPFINIFIKESINE